MRSRRPLLGLAALLLVGGGAAAEPGDPAAPAPAVWDDGVRPEPSALDARVGAGCTTDPSVAGDRLVGSPGTPAAGVDAVCTWIDPGGGSGAAHDAALQ